MYASLITATTGLLSLASAASIAPRQAAVVDVYFNGSNFQEGCSPGGCLATFNLTAAADEASGMPAFDVFCHPVYIQQGFIDCDAVTPYAAGQRVAAWWPDASVRENIKLVFEHIYPGQGDFQYNATGSIEFVGDGAASDFSAHITNLFVVQS
ncbi:hypothetical protein F5Y18DRAFT_427686 [Xylariaceae sp. FL1019]|nr:hypothetical protein F5Y18DRAFT_427686 [Xylariaceae sp. FL1019]